MLEVTRISGRRAGALTVLAPDRWRHPTPRAGTDRSNSRRITEIAHECRRFGLWRIADLMHAEGTALIDQRVCGPKAMATGCLRRGSHRWIGSRLPTLPRPFGPGNRSNQPTGFFHT